MGDARPVTFDALSSGQQKALHVLALVESAYTHKRSDASLRIVNGGAARRLVEIGLATRDGEARWYPVTGGPHIIAISDLGRDVFNNRRASYEERADG